MGDRAASGLPLSTNWVVNPERAVGIALMDEESGRYTGNEVGEYAKDEDVDDEEEEDADDVF